MYAHDTIAAVATPPGQGGVGILRVSGPEAATIGTTVFRRRVSGPWQSHRLYTGRVVDLNDTVIDYGLAVLMRQPHSYTGEDVFELHCHGSPVVLRAALAALLRAGARAAEPGEFTKRAFLNGRLDLAQAEAVAALIQARTPEGAEQARDQLFGHLSRHLDLARERLIRIKGHLEVQIDFSDEDGVGEIDLAGGISGLISGIDDLVRTYARGRLLREGVRVAIVGRPNVGKSSLLNALLGEERAIVTPIPGTTRDVIEEAVDFDGVPVVLVDTAGVREAPGEVERIGVERARQVAATADVILVVIDAAAEPVEPLPVQIERERAILVFNKVDLPLAWCEERLRELEVEFRLVRVSAKTGAHLDALRAAVVSSVCTVPLDGLPVLTTARQCDALGKARESLALALDGLQRGAAPELIAVDVQAALDHIGSVTGIVTSEDVLDRIFREFCIGK